MTIRRTASVLLAVLTLAVAGCSTASTPAENPFTSAKSTTLSTVAPQGYQYPTGLAGPYSVVWSTPEPIDLHSRPAELTRAYLESCQLSVFGRQNVYPGAVAAAPEPSLENQVGCLYATKRPEAAFPAYYGTLYARITELIVSDKTISAAGCYTRIGRAEVETHEPDTTSATAQEFSFTADLPDGSIDPRRNVNRTARPGSGTRAPQFDVFYPWKFRAVPWGTPQPAEGPPNNRDCARWAASLVDQVPAFSGQKPFTSTGRSATLTPRMFGERGFPTFPQTPAWPSP